MKKVLILDICDTLYYSNTTFDFFGYLNEEKIKIILKLKNYKIVKIINLICLKILQRDLVKEICVYYILKGKSLKDIDKEVSKFYRKVLKLKEKKIILKTVEKYQKLNFEVIIVSGTLEPIAKKIAKELGIERYFGSKLEVKKDKYTGRIVIDMYIHKEQVIRNILKENKKLYLLTDNITDYNLIKYMERSFIVLNKKNMSFWKKNKTKKIKLIEVN